MSRLQWYVARLRAMSPLELVYRASQALRRRARRFQAGRGAPFEGRDVRADADVAIEYFDVRLRWRPSERLHWSRDYKSGHEAPPRFYGDLDYRDAAQVGDSKYTWELNRQQFAVPWALEYARTGEERHAEAVAAVILDWIDANPRYVGLNWCSSLELALRILSWGAALEIAASAEPIRRARPRIARSVAEQARYIRHTLSLHSSANNHLMGELVGLLAAAVYFPETPRAGAHADFARDRLLAEAVRQNCADGVNREQAIYYHHYTLEYVLTALALVQRRDGARPRVLEEVARRMLDFLDVMTDDAGRPFPIGDTDDGHVTGLNRGTGVSVYESLLWSGWLVFGEAHLGAHAARIAAQRGAEPQPDRRSTYWHGPPTRPLPDLETRVRRRLFPEGGYFFSCDEDRRLLFKSGPFGYPSIAAHSHSDQLSVCLSLGTAPVLTDGGTYAYHTDARWRRFFKGVSAHNTVGVDGRDQADYAGPFLWSSHADGRLEVIEDGTDRFEVRGTHDGYRRLPDPVSHERRVAYRAGLGYRIQDRLRGERSHTYELYWNFASEAQLQPLGAHSPGGSFPHRRSAWLVVLDGAARLGFVVEADGEAELRWHHGDEAIPAGFESRAYRRKEPSHHLRLVATGPARAFTTFVLTRDDGDTEAALFRAAERWS